MIEAVFTTGVDEITAHGLTQWDKGQKLKITLSSLPASFEVHFAFKRSETAYVVDATASNGIATVSIPNAVLRQPADAMAWVYIVNGDAGETVKTIHLPIERRVKPADYVYEEAEIANFREIVNQRIDEYIESGVIVPGATVEEVTKIREFTIDQVEFEHTGNPAQFDSFSGCPLNCVTRIEPVQAGSGDPYPAGGGKNLLPPVFTSKTNNGVTYTVNSDGTITANGTATAASIAMFADFMLPAGDYILSGGGTVWVGLQITDANGANSYIASVPEFQQQKFTLTGTETGIRSYFRVNTGITVNNLTAYPMIRLASDTDSTYAPYSNIRPISGHTGAKLTSCGKNLLQNTRSTTTTNGITFTVNDDGSITANGTATDTATFIVNDSNDTLKLTNGKYVLSGCPTGGNASTGYFIVFYGYKGTTATHDIGDGVSVDFENMGGYYNIAVGVRKGITVSNLVFKPQLEVSAVATPYEPYQGDAFSASFGQTVYGGTLDWNTGVLTVEWKKVSGKMTRSTTDSSGKLYMISGVPYSVKQQLNGYAEDDPYVICSALPYKALEYARTSTEPCISQYAASVFVGGYIGREAELDAILASDDFQIAYKLATPATIQLTPAQLTALQGMNNIFCDAGETTVSGRKDILWLTDYLLKRVKELEASVATLQTAAVNNV